MSDSLREENDTTIGSETASEGAALKQDIYYASQMRLIWRKFKKHKLAVASGVVLIFMYVVVVFAEFLAPYDPGFPNTKFVHSAPARVLPAPRPPRISHVRHSSPAGGS